MSKIKFGTDGWRAVIGEDFIPENIEKVIQAFCNWSVKQGDDRHVILGFDRRLESPESAHLIASVLAGNGFHVTLADQFCPTPCVSWMVKNSDAFAGIMVTASHNPANWNGIKFKESYGGSASPIFTSSIEKHIPRATQIKKMNLQEAKQKGLISIFSPHDAYVKQLRSLIDVVAIKKSGIKIIFDPLYGAGSGFVASVLGMPVDEIHGNEDTSFGGINPEPIDKNLTELCTQMRTGKWQAGLATDGDADRIGAVDERGVYVNSHQIFALLLTHYIEDKKLKGTIVKSLSTTVMIDAICAKYGLKLIETPIGFKHICHHLRAEDALMGGEESGGISFGPHVHERDGVLNGLMLIEMMSQRGKTLSELLQELSEEFGSYYFDRLDLHLTPKQSKSFQVRMKEGVPESIGSKRIAKTNFTDGFKFIFDDNAWLLLRASGTEPLVRIYAEARDLNSVETLLEEGRKLVEAK